MTKHVHVHLHDAAPTKPPSSVIKPTPNAPHNPPKNLSGIKPAKATSSVIKPVVGGLNAATKGVGLINKTLRKAGELSEAKDASYNEYGNGEITWGAKDPKKALDAGTSEGAKKAAETRKRGGGAQIEQPHPRGAAGSKTSGQFTRKPLAENYTKRQTTAKGTIVKHSDAGTIDWLSKPQ